MITGGGGGWTYAGFSLCWCELCIVIAFIYCHLIERAHKTEDRKFLTVSSPFTKPAFGYANGNTLHIKFLLVVLRFCFSYCYDLRLYGNIVSFFFSFTFVSVFAVSLRNQLLLTSKHSILFREPSEKGSIHRLPYILCSDFQIIMSLKLILSYEQNHNIVGKNGNLKINKTN